MSCRMPGIEIRIMMTVTTVIVYCMSAISQALGTVYNCSLILTTTLQEAESISQGQVFTQWERHRNQNRSIRFPNLFSTERTAFLHDTGWLVCSCQGSWAMIKGNSGDWSRVRENGTVTTEAKEQEEQREVWEGPITAESQGKRQPRQETSARSLS